NPGRGVVQQRSDPLLQRGCYGDRVARLCRLRLCGRSEFRMDTCPSGAPSAYAYLVGHCVRELQLLGRREENMGPYMAARQYTYASGGYVFQFRGSLSAMQANINELKTLQWLDRQTRAVFIDLAFYNPNVNLFGIGPSYLSSRALAECSFEIACQVLFLLMLLGMIIKELAANIYKQRKAYFWSIWNLAELFILFGSIAAYAYVIYETSKLTEEFSKYGGNVYLNFQYVAFWNEYLTYFTAFIVFCVHAKVHSGLLRFQQAHGHDAARVPPLPPKDIRQILVMVFIMFCAFVQTFHLIFLQRLYGYSTFLSRWGKFKFLELYESSRFLGPLIFAHGHDCFVGLGQSRARQGTYLFSSQPGQHELPQQSLDEQLNVTLPSRVDNLLASFINKTYLRRRSKAKPLQGRSAGAGGAAQQKVKVAASARNWRPLQSR
uniref:PKD_channel domain-containing protein n=1 Tax=Macrostomum lignano TaxID=282301 RepID=A0A1I8FCC3_9PLAT